MGKQWIRSSRVTWIIVVMVAVAFAPVPGPLQLVNRSQVIFYGNGHGKTR